jgi:ankyrin repeat protein
MKTLIGGFCMVLLLGAASSDLRVPEAAQQGDGAAVRSLLQKNADVNAAQGDGMTALHWAAFKDDLETAQLLLQAGANPKVATRNGAITPLIMASKNGDAALIAALIKAGSEVNTATTDGMTPLMAAAVSGSVEAAKALLDHGANVNAKEASHSQTAVMFAAAENRNAMISLLAARGADLNATTTVIKLDAAKLDDDGNPLPVKKEDETITGGNSFMGGMTALLFAARDGNLDAVRALLESGAPINQVSGGEHSTPLVIAIANGHYEVGKFLLDHGANPNIANMDGLTPLYATINMQYAPVSWAPNPLTDQEKITHLDLMKALLEHGADPNAKLQKKLWFSPSSHNQQWINPIGATAFWRAAQATDVAAMRLLVQHGADPKIPTTGGTTALMVASGLGWAGNFSQTNAGAWLGSVKYCVELGLDVNAADTQGYTPLMGAAWRGNNDVIQFLADKGAKLDARNKKGWSVTDMANGPALRSSVPMTHPETIAFLTKLGAPPLTEIQGESILGSTRKARYGEDKKATPEKPPAARQ